MLALLANDVALHRRVAFEHIAEAGKLSAFDAAIDAGSLVEVEVLADVAERTLEFHFVLAGVLFVGVLSDPRGRLFVFSGLVGAYGTGLES